MARRGTIANIDLRELERLCALQPTDEEIAAFFEVSTRTIERRRRNPAFAEVMARGKAKGRLSVRRMQMKLLERGSAAMGIWLGKQLLGQVDHIDSGVDVPRVLQVICLPKAPGVPEFGPARVGPASDPVPAPVALPPAD
jgi:hypothetical protein